MSTTILGVPVHLLSRERMGAVCEQWLQEPKFHHIVTANPEILLRAHRDSAYRKTLHQAELILADGVGVCFAARLKNGGRIERITGLNVIMHLSRIAAREGKSIYLLGGREGVATAAAAHLVSVIPLLTAAAYSRDHRATAPPETLWDDLRRVRPSVLFVAYGAPTQERWIAEHRRALEEMGIRIAVGVGGAFDILSRRLPHAPHWLRAIGLEWLWRLAAEPWRLPRVFRATVVFPMLFLMYDS